MDEDQMYAYYDAKLKKYLTGGYGDIHEGGEDEDHVEKSAANVLDVTILDKETGLPWAYTTSNHDVEEDEPTPWAIFGDDDGEECKVPHWDGSEALISESEYIQSLFYRGDGQLGKFFVAGSKFMIVRRSEDMDTIMAGLGDETPEELTLVITGANSDYVCVAVQTNTVMILMCYNKKKHEASAAKKGLGELMMNLLAAEGEANEEGLFYGGQWPYEADPVGGEDF